jgi:hypothetical protein
MMKKRETAPAAKPVKPDVKPKPTARVVSPSEKLALLLRKESLLAARVRKAQTDLLAAQAEIVTLWDERQEQNRELVGGEV